MKYNKWDTVRFKHLDGSERVGKIVQTEHLINSYWVKVQESFSYQIPQEAKGKVIGYTQASSQYTEYLVREENVLAKEAVKELESAH